MKIVLTLCYLSAVTAIYDPDCSRMPLESIEAHVACVLRKNNHKSETELNERKLPNKRLAVLVPFRDRFPELRVFLPHMNKFIRRQKIPFHIFILQQVDKLRFNRGALFNVGFLYVRGQFDYIALHDVDKLPVNKNISYGYPEAGPMHITASLTPPDDNVGGILIITNEQYELVQGMSNIFWGWGWEDNELANRLKDAGLAVGKPKIKTENVAWKPNFKSLHNESAHLRDMTPCHGQLYPRRDVTGLRHVTYTLRAVRRHEYQRVRFTVLDVELHCDRAETPWCDCTGVVPNIEYM